MNTVFFNSFKSDLLSGGVSTGFSVTAYPIKGSFFDTFQNNTDISLNQFRTTAELEAYSLAKGSGAIVDHYTDASAYTISYDAYTLDDLTDKPMFVNIENFEEFIDSYGEEACTNETEVYNRLRSYVDIDYISDYTTEELEDFKNANSGFYYVKSKEELHWIADRCNSETDFNNKIRVVLGDDIGSTDLSYDNLGFCICPSAERHFQGILDFNGHGLINKVQICSGDVNGLIGYLGNRGIVRNGIVCNYLFKGKNRISLQKIEDSCTDVVAGSVVGVNYGKVENMITSGEMKFDNFCPEVYLVGNKYEYEENSSNALSYDYRAFYQNKFCINSIYNVIPYVGYFNEGADSFFNDVGYLPLKSISDYIDFTGAFSGSSRDFFVLNAKLSMGYYNYTDDVDYSLCQSQFMEPKCAILGTDDESQIVRYPIFPIGKFSDSNNKRITADFELNKRCSPSICGEFTHLEKDREFCSLVNDYGTKTSYDGLFSTEVIVTDVAADLVRPISLLWKDIERGAYLTRQLRDTIHLLFGGYEGGSTLDSDEKITIHQRLNPGSRIAYYCSPLVGNNFGVIQGIDCYHTLIESDDTFVGFIGNVCGKMNTGTIQRVNSRLRFRLNSSAENLKRVYKNDLTHYTDRITSAEEPNVTKIFGYNYDAYQNPYIRDDLEGYAENSGNLLVDPSLYDFDDFIGSGVNRRYYNDSTYSFKNYINADHTDYKNCNFYVTGDTDTVASENVLKSYRINLSNQSIHEFEEDTLYLRIAPDTAAISATEFQIFSNYNKAGDTYRSNQVINIPYMSSGARSTVLSTITGSLGALEVDHLSIEYLGDSYKTLDTSVDTLSFDLNSYTWDAGSDDDGNSWESGEYQITLSDALEYCPVLSGVVSGARAFSDNLQKAKIAMGCNVLGDLKLTSDVSVTEPSNIAGTSDSVWSAKPYLDVGSSDKNDVYPYSCTNSTSHDHETTYTGYYVIPAFTGPNPTNEDWSIFSEGYGFPMAWWWTPCSGSEINHHGYSEVTEPKYKRYCEDFSSLEGNFNEGSNNPKYFTSIREDGLWDVQAPGVYSDPTSSPEPNPGLWRSMVTIDFRYTSFGLASSYYNSWGWYKVAYTAWKSSDYYSQLSSSAIANTRMKLNNIRIPLANRSQLTTVYEPIYISGVLYKVCYLVASGAKMVIADGGELKANSNAKTSTSSYQSNVDYAYVEMIIEVPDEIDSSGESFNSYTMLIKLPISELRIPISCFYVGGLGSMGSTSTYTYTTDFTTTETSTLGNLLYYRDLAMYPILAAYTPSSVEDVTYTLQSIYNVGGICGMLNCSESYIENGNNSTRGNEATTCTITDCQIYIDDDTMIAINSLSNVDSQGNCINDRSMGVANKFAPIAAIYEYHANEMGFSPFCGIEYSGYVAGTDSLQNIALGRPTISDIVIAYESDKYKYLNHVVWGDLIQWANISLMTDYTNLFVHRYAFDNRDDDYEGGAAYIANGYSNYPEGVLFPMGSSNTSAMSLYGPGSVQMCASAYPVNSSTSTTSYPTPSDANIINPSIYQYAGDDIPSKKNVSYKNGAWMRSRNYKRYDYLVGNVLDLGDIYITSDWSNYSQMGRTIVQMSPQCNAPNSDYYDVFAPMFNGSSHLAFSRLTKAATNKSVVSVAHYGSVDGLNYNMSTYNSIILDRREVWRGLAGTGSTTQFSYWDYTKELLNTYGVGYKIPLTIKYVNDAAIDSSCTRGLWFHQDGPWDQYSWMKYRLSETVISDGSNLALGYMPIPDDILDLIANSAGYSSIDVALSVAVSDIAGFLLVRSGGKLVCVIKMNNHTDAEGAWIVEPAATCSLDGYSYGLLAAIKTEDSSEV